MKSASLVLVENTPLIYLWSRLIYVARMPSRDAEIDEERFAVRTRSYRCDDGRDKTAALENTRDNPDARSIKPRRVISPYCTWRSTQRNVHEEDPMTSSKCHAVAILCGRNEKRKPLARAWTRLVSLSVRRFARWRRYHNAIGSDTRNERHKEERGNLYGTSHGEKCKMCTFCGIRLIALSILV